MTREKLLEHICPTKNIDLCCSGATKIDCIDCQNVMNTYLGEYDKHVIAQYEAEHGNLADTIREIHDNVAQKMYCKGIDDLTEKLKEMANNSSTKYIRLSEKETITTYGVEQIAEELKAGVENE